MGREKTSKRSIPIIGQAQYVIIAILAIVITVIGFWQSYFGPFFYGTLDAHWAIHLHTAIFMIWLVLFLGQAVIAYKKKIVKHISVGTYFGIPWGAVILIIGFFITFAVIIPGIGREHTVDDYASSLLGSLGDIITFGIFFIAAVIYRGKPDSHKRLMVLATVALLGAPVARLGLFGGVTEIAIFIILRLLPLIVAMGYDRWLRNKVHTVYWIGLGILFLNISRLFWARTETWQTIGTQITKGMKPVMESIF